VTSPDKPETTDVPADTTSAEQRTVVTASPTPESKPAASGAPADGAKTTNESPAASQPKPATPAQPTPGQPAPAQPISGQATTAQAAQAKQQPAQPKPAQPAAEARTVEKTKPKARPAEEPPTVIAAVSGSQQQGPDLTSSAPPPWQRVASDAQYVTDHELPGDGSVGDDRKTTRFGEWGYQRSPRSTGYSTESPDPIASGVVSGSAASSVFAATAGQSGVHPDARPSSDPAARTTVNFGAPPSSVRPPAAASGAPSALRRPGRGPRRASLQVKRIDPWSVLKLAFVLSVALFFVWLVAVGVLYGVLDGMGVWDRVNGTYNEFAQNTSSGNTGPLITASRVFGIAAIIGAINIVLFTALATIGSFVYNVSADLAGGLEITLAERE
jgi:hypothetical protein